MEKFKPQLFDASNIDLLDWPNTDDGQYAKKYIEPLVKNGIKPYVDNLEVNAFALKIDSLVFPVVVAEEGSKNSYICSPYEHYISYGREVKLIDNPVIAAIVDKLLNGFSAIGRAGRINAVVYVNHWLFSTDLYPTGFTAEHAEAIVNMLKKRFPRHAIIFRSLNALTCDSVQKILRKLGFHIVASRQVHVTNTKNDAIFQTRIIKSDLKLWRESPFTVIDAAQLTSAECEEMLKLYNTLYIEQHSKRNPRYTLRFIKHLFDQRLLHFKVLKLGDQYKGVAGYYIRNGVMMCPFFGYDKTDPQHTAIYRMLSTTLLLAAKEQGLLFNQSAGASFYKSVRRAESCRESMAIYARHLPLKQKLVWGTFKTFINIVAPRYMKKY